MKKRGDAVVVHGLRDRASEGEDPCDFEDAPVPPADAREMGGENRNRRIARSWR
jgi:hypothetical protein